MSGLKSKPVTLTLPGPDNRFTVCFLFLSSFQPLLLDLPQCVADNLGCGHEIITKHVKHTKAFSGTTQHPSNTTQIFPKNPPLPMPKLKTINKSTHSLALSEYPGTPISDRPQNAHTGHLSEPQVHCIPEPTDSCHVPNVKSDGNSRNAHLKNRARGEILVRMK